MTDAQVRILTIGGLLLAMNAFFPPMLYENVFTSTGSNESTRHFFFVREMSPPAAPGTQANRHERQARHTLRIDAGRLTAQSFVVIGITLTAMGVTWPERRKRALNADAALGPEQRSGGDA